MLDRGPRDVEMNINFGRGPTVAQTSDMFAIWRRRRRRDRYLMVRAHKTKINV